MIGAVPPFPWTAEITILIISLATGWLAIAYARGRPPKPLLHGKAPRSDSRLIVGLPPVAIFFFGLAIALPSSYLVREGSHLLVIIGWILVVLSLLVSVLSLIWMLILLRRSPPPEMLVLIRDRDE